MTDLYTNPAAPHRHESDTRPHCEYHYFLSAFDVWIVGGDLNLALKRFWKESKSPKVLIFRVPLSIDAPYSIKYYVPQVEGVQLVDECFRNQREADKYREARDRKDIV